MLSIRRSRLIRLASAALLGIAVGSLSGCSMGFSFCPRNCNNPCRPAAQPACCPMEGPCPTYGIPAPGPGMVPAPAVAPAPGCSSCQPVSRRVMRRGLFGCKKRTAASYQVAALPHTPAPPTGLMMVPQPASAQHYVPAPAPSAQPAPRTAPGPAPAPVPSPSAYPAPPISNTKATTQNSSPAPVKRSMVAQKASEAEKKAITQLELPGPLLPVSSIVADDRPADDKASSENPENTQDRDLDARVTISLRRHHNPLLKDNIVQFRLTVTNQGPDTIDQILLHAQTSDGLEVLTLDPSAAGRPQAHALVFEPIAHFGPHTLQYTITCKQSQPSDNNWILIKASHARDAVPAVEKRLSVQPSAPEKS